MDIFTNLNYLKARILQLEFLSECPRFIYPVVDIPENVTIEELSKIVKEEVDKATAKLTPEQINEFDYSDYEVYTDKHYHRLFWNEISLPFSVQKLFDKTVELLGLKINEFAHTQYEICLYDLSDEGLYFPTREAAEEFANKYDLVPYTLYELKKRGAIFEALEIYSA